MWLQLLHVSRENIPPKKVWITVLVSLSLAVVQGALIFSIANSLREEAALQGRQMKFVNIQPIASLYKDYLQNFDKSYDKEETMSRFHIFKNSLKEIYRLNQETGATHGLTKFSDMSTEEVFPHNSQASLGDCRNFGDFCMDKEFKDIFSYDLCDVHRLRGKLPDKFDWRDQDAVGPVLDQKLCKGCWAFGIVGVMESMAAIQNIEHHVSRSIQELIDCSKGYSEGCERGNVGRALYWLCGTRLGVVREDEYPLRLVTGECRLKYNPVGRRVKHYCQMCNVTTDAIVRLVAYHGPVMAVVNAQPWMFYTGGVIQRACYRNTNSNSLDHVVQIVGYDLTAEVPHYIIRNSWGEDFGVDGYVKLALEGNVCGVRDEITFLDVY